MGCGFRGLGLAVLGVALLAGAGTAGSAGPGMTLLASIPIGSSPRGVAVDPSLNRVFVGHNVAGTMTVVDGGSNTVLGVVPLSGGGVDGIAADPATHRVYAALWYSGAVDAVDGATMTRIGTSPFIASYLRGVALDPSRNRLYVTTQSGTLFVRRLNDLGPVGSVAVGAYPQMVAVDRTHNKAYTANLWSGNVSVVDLTTLTATSVATGFGPYAVTASSTTSRVYAGLDGGYPLRVIDGATNTVIASVPSVGASLYGAAVDESRNVVYCADNVTGIVAAVDGATNAVLSTISLGRGIIGLAVNPTTNRVYVSGETAAGSRLFVLQGVGAPPSVVVPPSVSAECQGPDGATVTFPVGVEGAPPPTAALQVRDLSGGRTLLSVPAAPGTYPVTALFPMGPSTVEARILDGTTELARGSFVVAVSDTTPPALGGVGPKTVECRGVATPVTPASLGITASDLCDPSPVLTLSVASLPMGTSTVTAAARDASGNVSTASFQVTVRDTTPPSITAPPAVTAECTGPGGQAVPLGDPVVADPCDPSPVVANDAPALFSYGTTAVTWTATDRSGNRASATQAVHVVDTTPPALVAPPDVTVEATSPQGQPVALGTPAVSDVCGPVTVSNDAPALFRLGTATVTWTATDVHGLRTSRTQRVTVRDTTAPAISAAGLPGELWPPNHRMVRVQASLSVSDAGDAAPAVTLVVASNEPDDGLGDGDTAGDIVVRSPSDLDLRAERSGTGQGRTYTLRWTATDASGNSATVTATVRVPKSQGR